MSLDKQADMINTLESVGNEYGLTFTAEEINKFKVQKTFGVNIKQLKAFLALKAEDQDAQLQNLGIPTDSTDNQFKVWVKNARISNGKDLRIAIKADQKTPYKVIKSVMNSLQDLNENRYNLITSLKVESSAKK
jgi:biopolymer transport protein ExbD